MLSAGRLCRCAHHHLASRICWPLGGNLATNQARPGMCSTAATKRWFGSSGSEASSSSILLGDHVRQALANQVPIVALESTVITHGLPEPENLKLALDLEHEIGSGNWWQAAGLEQAACHRMAGQVVAATVGIVRGQLIVGLSRDQLEYLGRLHESRPIKCSRRDVALTRALKLNAGTTVSGTLAILSMLGPLDARRNSLRVFATGGLGGVHLDGQNSMDISADLHELGRSGDSVSSRSLGIVSAGFKSFLDTRRSLELLETLGVTVASLAQTDRMYEAVNSRTDLGNMLVDPDERRSHVFPGFFTRENKEQVKSPWQCSGVHEAARVLFHCLEPLAFDPSELDKMHQQPQQRSMLLACPIPREFTQGHLKQLGDHHDDYDYEQALKSASESIDTRLDLNGYEKTPLILDELNRLTGGKTLQANLALLKNNARIGAHLAYELALEFSSSRTSCCVVLPHSNAENTEGKHLPAQRSPVVIGCTMIDMHVKTKIDNNFRSNRSHSGVTFAGKTHLSLGGVGHNLAAALELLGHKPVFVTSLADDNLAQFARLEMDKSFGKRRLKVLPSNADSSCFALVLIDSLTGLCEYVLANLDACQAISSQTLLEAKKGAQTNKTHHSNATNTSLEHALASAPLLVMDANLPSSTIEYMIEFSGTHNVPIFIEPTDVNCLPSLVKSLAISSQASSSLTFMSPNAIELAVMLELFSGSSLHKRSGTNLCPNPDKELDNVQQMAQKLLDEYLPKLKCLLVTMDSRGVLVALRVPVTLKADNAFRMSLAKLQEACKQENQNTKLIFKHFEPVRFIENPVSGSGAGDCFAAGFISAYLDRMTLDECVRRGSKASIVALGSMDTVPVSLRYLASEERRQH